MKIFISVVVSLVTVWVICSFFNKEKNSDSEPAKITAVTPTPTPTPPKEMWKKIGELKGFDMIKPVSTTTPTEWLELRNWNTGCIRVNTDCIIELQNHNGEEVTVKYIFEENSMYVKGNENFSTEKWTGFKETLNKSKSIRFLPLEGKEMDVVVARSLDHSLPMITD